MKANSIDLVTSMNGSQLVLGLSSTIDQDKLLKLKKATEDGKLLEVSVDLHRNKRSLNANSYLWCLLTKMADVLGTTKDELYIEVLDRYGRCRHITTPLEAVEDLKSAYRYIRVLDNVMVNGKEVAHILCFIGSSNYNSLEMSKLLNGVVDEAKALGIETETQEEIDRLVNMINE